MSIQNIEGYIRKGGDLYMYDNEIVDLFLARDETAINRTSEKYGRKLHSLAYSVCKEMTTAEECENDTYLKAWNSIPPTHAKDLFVLVPRQNHTMYRHRPCQRRNKAKAQYPTFRIDT